MAQFKYITNGRIAIVFSEAETHADMAQRMFGDRTLATSAGFGRLDAMLDGHGIEVSVYGASTTLKVGSNEKDEWLVKCALGLYGF